MKSAEYWDRLAQKFIDRGHRDIWRRYSDELNAELVARYLKGARVERVLKTDLFDEALVTGVAGVLSALAIEVHGIDISSVIVETAARQYPGAYFQAASVTQLPFPDGYFQAVVSLSTLDQLETIDEIKQGLSEIRRVLAPGGRLLVSFDNLSNPLIALRKTLPFVRAPYFMGESVTVLRLEELLRATGFGVEEKFTYMHAPRAIAIPVCRMLEHRPYGPVIAKLRLFEKLDHLPTRNWTANFCGALVRK